MLKSDEIKKDFPIFRHIPGFVYLDSTATSLKPQSVINSLTDYYSYYSANIFRGVYDISEKATAAYEETRMVVKDFIGAESEKEIIFTRNATESINLFVNGIENILHMGDEIATTIAEHHSNFVPWQQLAKRKGLTFTVMIPETSTNGDLIQISTIKKYISTRTKVLAITHTSNVFGSTNSLKEIINEARRINPDILILVDGAQAVPHCEVDVQNLGCDAFAFSSHKMLGPTGVGVLWVKEKLLDTLSPYQYGGDMIRSVAIAETQFADIPHRFEAGTPHIAGVIALKQAILYLQKIGLKEIHQHEIQLSQLCYDTLKTTFGDKIQLIGPQKRESGIVAFVLKNIHAHDVAQILNEDNIAVRAGHHCAMPLHTFLGIEASVRASFYLYNSPDDVEKLALSIKKVLQLFKQ